MFTSTPPNNLLAFTCITLTLQSRVGSTPTAVTANALINLTVNPPASVRWYSDPSCTTEVTSTTIPAGQSSVTFYARPISGVTETMTATGFAVTTQQLFPRGVVRRNSCAMAAPLADGGEDHTAFCSINPDLFDPLRAFVMTTATANSANAPTQMVRCRISSMSTVMCDRDNGAASANIEWQTVELPVGLTVQRQQFTCSGPPMLRTFTAVNPASSFVLRSNKGSGSDIDEDDLAVARLISPTQVEVDLGVPGVGSCSGADYDLQLVDYTGVTVTHGTIDAGLPIGVATYTESGLPPVSIANTVLLVQHRAPDSPRLCTELVRGELTSSTSITFTRGAGLAAGAGCTIDPVLALDWQRIDFGTHGTVQVRNVTMPANQMTQGVPIMSVDTTRTIAFTSTMGNGNGGGETSYVGSGYYGSEAMVRIDLTSSTNVQLTRQRDNGIGMFTLYVVQLEP